ncbi:MAG: hypothetical protein ABI670_16260 [Chloroflexota bacterium]
MAKKTTRAVSQQRTKEDQWRRRVASQTRATTPTLGGARPDVIDEVELDSEDTGYTQADMRQMPANVAMSAAATRTAATSAAARTTTTNAATTVANQRRALAATRAARGRAAANVMTIDDEMRYVREDVRNLIFLTVLCFAVLIVLAFVIK